MSTWNILFVCLGNICRSPMAEYVLRHEAALAGVSQLIRCDSAGTSGWHDGEDMHRGTAAMLKQHGIAPTGFSSRRVRVEDWDTYDYLIAMDGDNLAELERRFGRHPHKIFILTDLIPECGINHVPDPWYTGDFAETYRLCRAGSLALLQRLTDNGGTDR